MLITVITETRRKSPIATKSTKLRDQTRNERTLTRTCHACVSEWLVYWGSHMCEIYAHKLTSTCVSVYVCVSECVSVSPEHPLHEEETGSRCHCISQERRNGTVHCKSWCLWIFSLDGVMRALGLRGECQCWRSEWLMFACHLPAVRIINAKNAANSHHCPLDDAPVENKSSNALCSILRFHHMSLLWNLISKLKMPIQQLSFGRWPLGVQQVQHLHFEWLWVDI